MGTLANSEDPDELRHFISVCNNAAFHQGLYCLLRQSQSSEKEIYIPITQNSVQSHNSVRFLLYTCLTSLNKDSESLHSALVVKTEICEKNRFFE